jgi:hypothetical protein
MNCPVKLLEVWNLDISLLSALIPESILANCPSQTRTQIIECTCIQNAFKVTVNESIEADNRHSWFVLNKSLYWVHSSSAVGNIHQREFLSKCISSYSFLWVGTVQGTLCTFIAGVVWVVAQWFAGMSRNLLFVYILHLIRNEYGTWPGGWVENQALACRVVHCQYLHWFVL